MSVVHRSLKPFHLKRGYKKLIDKNNDYADDDDDDRRSSPAKALQPGAAVGGRPAPGPPSWPRQASTGLRPATISPIAQLLLLLLRVYSLRRCPAASLPASEAAAMATDRDE